MLSRDRINAIVEKPQAHLAPSNLATHGAYILPPEIFGILEKTTPGRGGEIQLTDALATLCAQSGLTGLQIDGQRFDVGDRAGYVLAMVHYALRRPEIRDDVRAGILRMLEA